MTDSEVDTVLLSSPLLGMKAEVEFKERSLQPNYVVGQLKLFYNDCDRRSNYLLRKADRYRRYSWTSLFVSIALGCAAFPFLYWIRAKEYTVARQRKPLRVKNFLLIGISLAVSSVGTSMFAASNLGFGFQARAMLKFASAYDELAWEARKFQYQLDMKKFSDGRFMLTRKLDYRIEDEETTKKRQADLDNGIERDDDESTHFSQLLLKDELAEAQSKEKVMATRKDEKKQRFMERAFGKDVLTPVSIAYYEFVDKKKLLDDWY